MGLNSRKAQIIMAVLPILSCSLLMFWPFTWRALQTKRASDIKIAILFSSLEVIGLLGMGLSDRTGKAGPDNWFAMVVWVFMLAATIAAAWLYRPLNKEERMDQVQQNRSGSSYL